MSVQFELLNVQATGTQVTTSASTTTTTIPNDASGNRAKAVRLQVLSGNCYVKPGFAGGTCTVNDILLNPNEGLHLWVKGFTSILSLQGAAGEKFNITPIEC